MDYKWSKHIGFKLAMKALQMKPLQPPLLATISHETYGLQPWTVMLSMDVCTFMVPWVLLIVTDEKSKAPDELPTLWKSNWCSLETTYFFLAPGRTSCGFCMGRWLLLVPPFWCSFVHQQPEGILCLRLCGAPRGCWTQPEAAISFHWVRTIVGISSIWLLNQKLTITLSLLNSNSILLVVSYSWIFFLKYYFKCNDPQAFCRHHPLPLAGP